METKPVHTIILDSSPLLLNTPGISTLLARGHVLVTTPSVLSEIRGEEHRHRIETLYKPFLTVRTPKPESVKVMKEFARKTGDAAVLSATDFEILALAYEIECERNGGDWRLRKVPGQKRVNGAKPHKVEEEEGREEVVTTEGAAEDEGRNGQEEVDDTAVRVEALALEDTGEQDQSEAGQLIQVEGEAMDSAPEIQHTTTEASTEASPEPQTNEADSDSNSDGWITPSNIKRRQVKDSSASQSQSSPKHLQVATMTGDFAMQNVLLQMNLNLLSSSTCLRISSIKQFIFRCHACFSTTKDLSRQFCERCGKPTLTRVSTTTNDKGEVKVHLKKNMTWNNRGDVYSIPKPVSGNANQKWKGPKQGGGQGGWGRDLILAEDQKEYVRAMSTMKRTKEKDLMDEDILPGILSGNRGQTSNRPRVGAGRNVNSRKR